MNLRRDQLFAPLKQYFGFASFRPLQEEIIRDSLAGKDVFAVLPTGGGKSLCFQLPALVAARAHRGRLAAHRVDERPGGRAAGGGDSGDIPEFFARRPAGRVRDCAGCTVANSGCSTSRRND